MTVAGLKGGGPDRTAYIPWVDAQASAEQLRDELLGTSQHGEPEISPIERYTVEQAAWAAVFRTELLFSRLLKGARP